MDDFLNLNLQQVVVVKMNDNIVTKLINTDKHCNNIDASNARGRAHCRVRTRGGTGRGNRQKH